MSRTVGMMVAIAGLLGVAPADGFAKPSDRRAAVDPTRLQLVEPRAGSAISDGERFVVITLPLDLRRQADVYDTFTGERTSLPSGCRLAGTGAQTTIVTAGRALVSCGTPPVYRVLDLATGTSTDLPTEIEAGGMRLDPWYSVLGSQWVQAYGACPAGGTCAALYYNYRTGETRVSRNPDGPEFRSRQLFYDLDAPDLPLQRVCRQSISYDASVRHYRAPHYVDRYSGLRRCSDGKIIQRIVNGGDVIVDLTATAMAWGTTNPATRTREFTSVHVYQIRPKRLLSWKLPPLNGRRAYGTAITTRCEIFALTSRAFGDRGGGVISIRVHRARLPAPRDPRCVR